MVAAHIEGSWHPAYLKHYFHVSVPLKGNFFLETCFFLIIPILNITGEMKIMANRNCSIFKGNNMKCKHYCEQSASFFSCR
jgi:hypothetical protein